MASIGDLLAKVLRNPGELHKLTTPQLAHLAKELKQVAVAIGATADVPDDLCEFAETYSRGEWQRAAHLELIAKKLQQVESGEVKRLIITCPPRHGKALAHETPVLTPEGWKLHGDLHAGDVVYSPAGKPVMVLAEGPELQEEAYEVKFDFGSVVAHANHEWLVEADCELYSCGGGPGRHRHPAVMETRSLLRSKRAEAVRLAAAIDMPAKPQEVDPYLLGVWLGDGSKSSAAITVGEQDIAHFSLLGDAKQIKPWIYRVLPPGLASKLRRMGLRCNKHIPDNYLLGSTEQRLALLQGLMDTDGYVSTTGQCEFTNTNKAIAEGVQYLCCSLGLKPSMTESDATLYGRVVSKKWRVLFSPPPGFVCFRLKRKQSRLCVENRPRSGHRYVRAVVPVGPVKMKCIEVEGGLYLAGSDLIPTHNSFLTSKFFPLWYLSRNPKKNVIFCAYAADFASRWGRYVRDLVIEHGEKLSLALDGSTMAADTWNLLSGGGMITRGVGGGIMGRGADLLIIDDPVKDAEEAGSEVMRDKLWDWWTTTASTRIEPEGGVVLIMTRWHQDDLVGKLLQAADAGEGPKWEVINLPAYAEEDDLLGREPGEALWPERWPLEKLQERERGMSPYEWAALFQQRPSPEEGGSVKRAWWKFYDVPPAKFEQVIQSWDLAFKDLSTSDFTVGQVWGRNGAEFYLLHQVRSRMNAAEVCQAIRNVTLLYPKATAKLIENKANGPAVIAMLAHEVAGIVPINVKGSKDARLNAAIPLIQAGNVYLPHPKHAPWVTGFVEEMAAFPTGANDDQLDACTQALNFMVPAGWQHIAISHKEGIEITEGMTPIDLQRAKFTKWTHKKMKIAEKKLERASGDHAYSRHLRGMW